MFLLNFVDAKLGKRWKKNETEGKRNYRGIQGPLDHPDLIVIFFFLRGLWDVAAWLRGFMATRVPSELH